MSLSCGKHPVKGTGAPTLFSQRTAWSREDAPLAALAAARRARGEPILDLTASNPTRCGFAFDDEARLQPLSAPDVLHYEPVPFGRAAAREAVRGYYAGHGAPVDVEHVCLTSSTSEGYSFLFRLLCDPGDEVLIASPSYPLFDYLAALDDVRLRSYPLLYDHGWGIEPGAIEARIGPRTRAIALVHPNNPTGHFTSPAERAALEELCVQYGLALIVDEVFLDYPWHAAHAESFASGPHPALCFVLSGLSKVAAMPQMKLAWIAVCGPADVREEARARLEVIADTFLSVSAPVQAAAPAWLASCEPVQQQIRARVDANLANLDRLLEGTPVSRLSADGGWYVVLRVPAVCDDEVLACRLLKQSGVLVHPGSAFGFAPQGWLVLSLLPQTDDFAHGVRWLVRLIMML